MSPQPPTQFHHHGRFHVAGGSLPDAITAYRTYGDPANPCIVLPTYYGGRLDGLLYMLGEGKVLDPKKYFVVTFALFSNGESSSPSNTPAPYNGPYFPAVSYEDNIRAQHAVLQKLGIKKVHAVVGFSMGAQQAYHWAVIYPEVVERYVVICGSARTSPHNQCFLEGPKAALVASKDFYDGHYKEKPEQGLRAFARVFSAWAYGQTWFREHKYNWDGLYPDLNTFLREGWENAYLHDLDANDLITLLHTWQRGDISKVRHGGNLQACLNDIQAKGLILPSKSDLFFPPEDSVDELASLTSGSARLVVIDSVWGHAAGWGVNPQDDAFIQAEIKKFLEE